MVTIEAALALASMVTVLGIVIAGISAILTQIAVQDAAREAARVAAIAGPQDGRAHGQRALDGHGDAAVSITTTADTVTAEASSTVAGFPSFVGLRISATAVAYNETHRGTNATP